MIAEYQVYHLQMKDVATGEDLSGCHTISADRAIVAVVGELLFCSGRVSTKCMKKSMLSSKRWDLRHSLVVIRNATEMVHVQRLHVLECLSVGLMSSKFLPQVVKHTSHVQKQHSINKGE